jgi:hypothetical protein
MRCPHWNWIRLTLLGVMVFPLIASAEAPSTRPSTQPATRPTGGPNRPEGAFRPRRDALREAMRDGLPPKPPTPDEIEAATKFCQENFPNHYGFFARLPENGQGRRFVIPKMVQRYRMLMHMQENNPDAYKAMLEQSKIQDQALGYARDLFNEKPGAESKLRESIRQMVDKGLTDRQERIMKLRRMLDEQERKLKQDQDNRDKMVDEQIDKTKKEADRMLKGKDGPATAENTDKAAPPEPANAAPR